MPAQMSFQPPAITVVRTVSKARQTQLDGLVPRLGKAAVDKLRVKYCTDKHVSFALSMESMGEPSDDFDEVVSALSLVPALIRTGERTGAQAGKVDKNNVLVKDAEARAKKK